MTMRRPAVRRLLAAACLYLQVALAQAAIAPALLQPLAGDDPDARIEAVAAIAALGNADARQVLQALHGETLYATAQGRILIADGEQASDPASGEHLALPEGSEQVVVNNRLRGALEQALSGLALLSPQRQERLAAAQDLQRSGVQPAQAPLLRRAYAQEKDEAVRDILLLLVSGADLQSPDAAVRLAAVAGLAESANPALRPTLEAMVANEPDPSVRSAGLLLSARPATAALRTAASGDCKSAPETSSSRMSRTASSFSCV